MGDLEIMHAVLGPVQTNCYIVRNPSYSETEVLLVDPGAEAERLIAFLDENGYCVTAILLTHAHFDHIGAVDEVKKKYPALTVYISAEDAAMMKDPDLNASFSLMRRGITAQYDKTLQDEEILSLLGISVKCLATPGHTAGGMCFYIEEEHLLFSGDTLFQGSVGRTDLPTGSASEIERSCKERLFVLPEETNVLPGHGDATTIGYEKKYNMYLS